MVDHAKFHGSPAPFQFQRRVGNSSGAAGNQLPPLNREKTAPRKTPIQQAKELLGKVNTFVALAKTETKVIREIARNLTLEGREINLWEIMTEVNNTIRENPRSEMARLMKRFYREYLVSSSKDGNNDVNVHGDIIYQKTLPSLLFLSFGIFLLNSVNQIIARRGLAAGAGSETGRKFGGSGDDNHGVMLENLLELRPELKQIFNEGAAIGGSGNEEAANNQTATSDTAPGTMNAFLKLLMNLMNAYDAGDNSEVECIWSAYCHQLNRQASLGGMVSTVARINAVGMRAVLQEGMGKSEAFRRVVNNMWSWEDMKCDEMFPHCAKNEGEAGKAEEKGPDESSTESGGESVERAASAATTDSEEDKEAGGGSSET